MGYPENWMDAPERIWADHGGSIAWDDDSGLSTEYVRADLYAALEQEHSVASGARDILEARVYKHEATIRDLRDAIREMLGHLGQPFTENDVNAAIDAGSRALTEGEPAETQSAEERRHEEGREW